jgi:hypothetical protein
MSEEKQVVTKVTNFNQAVSVLIQAAHLGRKAGIYEFEDLDLIGQSVMLLEGAQAEAVALAKEQQEAEQNEVESKDESDAGSDLPEPETKEVILEPTKD